MDQADQEVVVQEVLLHEVLQEVAELEAVAQKAVLLNLNLQVALLEKRKTKQYSIFQNTLGYKEWVSFVKKIHPFLCPKLTSLNLYFKNFVLFLCKNHQN